MRYRGANFPISYTQGTGNQEINGISLISNDLEFPGAASEKGAIRKLKSGSAGAPQFEVRRCYQPADLPLDALADVLSLLLEENPKPASSTADTSTCFPAPNE